MNTAPTLRLHLYFAQTANVAVILRQGPTRQFRMILWHLADDRFEDGQWIKQKVYPERCAISPDGRHFLSFVLDGQWGSEAKGSYTVISRPPWFTALALYPQGDTWGGGGYFTDNHSYVINSGPTSRDIIGRATGLKRIFPDTPPSKNAADRADADGRSTQGSPKDCYEVQDGKLYRRNGAERLLIRDFTDMSFEPILAPYGDSLPDAQDWHPLDGDR